MSGSKTLSGRGSPLPGGRDDPGTAELRAELRRWLADHLTVELVEAARLPLGAADIELLRRWNAELADAGWAAPSWPVEHGGRAATVAQHVAWLEEMDRARAPGPINVIGVSNIAPAIWTFGTDAQKERFLLPMLRGEEIWSQGMSEPGAGSDLASLRTRAEPDGDGGWVVNGQKTWTSLGHLADWCQLYVRTDPEAPKHKGISCLLVDLRTPGIEARPLRSITGDHSFAELFFSDVAVPREALLGEEHRGWTVAMATLGFERAGVARLHLVLAAKLADLLAEPSVRDRLAHDAVARQHVAEVHSRISAMRWLTARHLAEASPGPTGSLAKLSWSRIDQQLGSLAVDLVGPAGCGGRWADNLASVRQASIAGGTTEINLDIVGESLLGLPREPS
jgi:alkylation response protein AidB-like acyl-CoA dehydrogenase